MFNGAGWGAVSHDLSAAPQPYVTQKSLGELFDLWGPSDAADATRSSMSSLHGCPVVPCSSLTLVIPR
jgi:hypothetical protein